MRKIHFADSLEERIAMALDIAGVAFVHESENKKQELDFYLPSYDVYIEVNKFHSDIIAKDNVIVIQGVKAVELFETILMQCTISPF